MRKTLKKTAQKALKGNWGKAVGITLLPVAFLLLIILIQTLLAMVFGYPLVMDVLTQSTSLDQIKDIPLFSWLVALGGILAGILFFLPLNLGTKRWFFRLFSSGIEENQNSEPEKDIAALNIHFKDMEVSAEEAETLGEEAPVENPTIVFEPLYSAEQAGEETLPEENQSLMEEALVQAPSFGEVFDFFAGAKNYFGSIWFHLVLAVRSLLWLLLFSLPGAALLGVQLYLLGIFSKEFTMPEVFGNEYLLLIPAAALLLFSWCICGVFLLRYFAAPYFWAAARENPQTRLNPSSAIKKSIKTMRGKKLRLIGNVFTFTGWGLLLVFLLPALYTVPYYQAFLAAFVSKAIADEYE